MVIIIITTSFWSKKMVNIWLGVPGIYDAREARAADLFGFPQFTSSYVSVLELGDDERNNDALFGHWCRYLATK